MMQAVQQFVPMSNFIVNQIIHIVTCNRKYGLQALHQRVDNEGGQHDGTVKGYLLIVVESHVGEKWSWT